MYFTTIALRRDKMFLKSLNTLICSCFLTICAISKLRCAFCQLLNCVPILTLHMRFQNYAMRLLRNLEMDVSEQDTLALDSSDHTFTPTKHVVRRERSLGQGWMSVSTHTVCDSRSIAAISSQKMVTPARQYGRRRESI